MPNGQPSAEDGTTKVQALGQLLIDGGLDQLSKRERRVIATIAQRRHVTRNVNRELEVMETPGDRIADRVAQFGGSWTFILIFIAVLAGWILFNTVLLTQGHNPFDSYPFIFLNLMLSMVAALQAPVILMSQNRQAARDRVAAALDYEVNLKAELEIMSLHEKLDTLRVASFERMLTEQGRQLGLLLNLVRANFDGAGKPSTEPSR